MDNFKPDHGENLTGREQIQVTAILLTVPGIVLIPSVLSVWHMGGWEPYEWARRIYETCLFINWLMGVIVEWNRWKTYEQKQGNWESKKSCLALSIFFSANFILLAAAMVLQHEFPAPFSDIVWMISWKEILLVLLMSGVLAGFLERLADL